MSHRLDSRERCRNLWEAVNQGRRMIELADHKARYALVVVGVVNAVVFLLAVRSHTLIGWLPPSLQPAFPYVLVPLALLAVIFLVDAYNSLRPRPPALQEATGGVSHDPPLGLVFWDRILMETVAEYQAAWDQAHQGQLNHELAAMAHSLARNIHAKYAALHRLYIELLLIILLASVILAVPLFFGFFHS